MEIGDASVSDLVGDQGFWNDTDDLSPGREDSVGDNPDQAYTGSTVAKLIPSISDLSREIQAEAPQTQETKPRVFDRYWTHGSDCRVYVGASWQ